MACISCGLRHRPKTDYCDQCGCPVGVLAPPPGLQRWELRPQHLGIIFGGRALGSAEAALLGLLCVLLGCLPDAGPFMPSLAVLLGGLAVRRARARRRPARWSLGLAWVVVGLGGAGTMLALSGL